VLADLLQRVCSIPVSFIEDGERIEADRVYVAPPNKEVNVYKGELHLLEMIDKRQVLPIDFFLRSLARARGQTAAAVILSGTGTDGTLGIKEIKNHEGIVLVQSVESAQYDGMPSSALETAVVDRAIEVKEMPGLLKEYFENNRASGPPKEVPEEEKHWLNKVFAILVTHVGHDFSVYKRSTILRRIYRRMGLNRIEDHETYIKFLRTNSNEVNKLFQELLIGVTNFFRDKESFDVLKNEVLPKLIGNLPEDSDFRVWVPGCSTGEEVYSLAMVVQEYLDESPKRLQLQFFGTDIDERAIRKARQGIYPSGISADVDDRRLSRFFFQEGDNYRIRKNIRDKIVFSVQDVIKDPPFLRVHLLCCRNLLIYLDAEVQKKLIPLFHYALRPKGVLMLGSSESLGQFTNLFASLNSKWKLYKRKEVPQSIRGPIEFPTGSPREESNGEQGEKAKPEKRQDFERLAREAVLRLAAPASVLVDGKGTILYVHGRTGAYLEPASGQPSNNIVEMARQGLRFELSSSLRRAADTGEPVVRRNIEVKTNGNRQAMRLSIYPTGDTRGLEGSYLVVFRETETEAEKISETDEEGVAGGTGPSAEARLGESGKDRKIRELEEELQNTRESHQTTIEELESSNEELKSTNEELQSSNEELQSTNEELESSKEELQSLNEELQTVNSELQSKVEELSAARDDMANLLNGIEVAAVFVDNQIRIRRFTTQATSIVSLLQSDVGRPLADMRTKLPGLSLVDEVGEVLERLASKEREVQNSEGNWYLMRIVPYRTTENRIDGAVLTFLDIDDQKRAQHELEQMNREKEQERLLIRRVFDRNDDPLAVLDKDGRLILANTAFHALMKLAPEEVEGTDILSFDHEILSATDLRKKLQKALKTGKDFRTKEFVLDRKGEEMEYRMVGQIVQNAEGQLYRILLVFERAI